jgi:acetyltransferase
MTKTLYPLRWERVARTRDGIAYRIRPIRVRDAARERAFIEELSPQARYDRFMGTMRAPSSEFVRRMVDVDYDRDMAFVAVTGNGHEERIIGVARYASDPDGLSCEIGLAVADAWQASGVGSALMQLLFAYARRQGLVSAHGRVLRTNDRMLELARWMGMQVEDDAIDPTTVDIRCSLVRSRGSQRLSA